MRDLDGRTPEHAAWVLTRRAGWTPGEIAPVLGVHVNTVRRWRRKWDRVVSELVEIARRRIA